MQKGTKDLFIKLKAIRPSIHSISYYYGIDWKSDRLIEKWYLEIPKPISYDTEKELCEAMKAMISSTESDLGFRFPETIKKVKLE